MVKTGLICIALEGERLELAEKFLDMGRWALEEENIKVVNENASYTLSEAQVESALGECLEKGAESVIFLVGTWIFANHVVKAAMSCPVPIAIWGMEEAVSFSAVGTNVLHGALEEMGIAHELFYGMPGEKGVMDRIRSFCKGSSVVEKMKGLRLGILGGRAIGAYPTAADPNQVKELFGIEVEHLDQLLLLERAREIPDEKAKEKIDEIRNRYGKVIASEEILKKSVKVYWALREIIEENHLDMCSVKCLGEFINYYTSCCLALTLLNDEGYLVGCQCNINGMISSWILAQLSETPPFFGDVNVVEKETGIARVINCGSVPGRLAESYEDIQIVPQYAYMGKGGGACTFFCMKEGPVTFGTLQRIHGSYAMSVAFGQAVKKPLEELARVRTWAQGFVRLQGDAMEFFENIRCNHSVFCYGNVVEELKYICKLLDVKLIVNQ